MDTELKSRNREVALEIQRQIGRAAFAMIGAHTLLYGDVDGNSFLSFRFRGSKIANYCRITLNGLDLYDLRFARHHGVYLKEVATEENVYAEDLARVIERVTGLYLSLGDRIA